MTGEMALYQRLIGQAPAGDLALAQRFLALDRGEQTLALISVAFLRPGLLEEVLDGVESLPCLTCEHERHARSDCGAGMFDASGIEVVCWCSPSAIVKALRYDELLRERTAAAS